MNHGPRSGVVTSPQEQRDYRNVVMSMCKLGCDDLFERGYIAVKDGEVVALPRPHMTDELTQRVKELAGRRCGHYTPASAKYFEWHYRAVAEMP